MQLSRLTLRSKKPELVEQELWGVLLAYNLVRYQMIKMAEHLKGYWPNQLSFSESCGMVMRMLMTLQGASPGRIPELMRDLASMGQLVKLPTRRERGDSQEGGNLGVYPLVPLPGRQDSFASQAITLQASLR